MINCTVSDIKKIFGLAKEAAEREGAAFVVVKDNTDYKVYRLDQMPAQACVVSKVYPRSVF